MIHSIRALKKELLGLNKVKGLRLNTQVIGGVGKRRRYFTFQQLCARTEPVV